MKKTINYSFKKFNTYDNKELSAASKVIKSGILSKYLAEKGSEFNGGYYVNKFEQMLKTNSTLFFDVQDFENIIHHYIDSG